MTKKRYTVTSALPYTNGPVHIGHLAGAYLPADIYVRYLRLKHGSDKVLYVCGSDEHGVPITLTAKKEGITPQEVVDRYHEIIKKSFADFGISFNIYHRTSDKLHHETASEFFKTLYDKGIFTEQESEQYYDEEQKQFLADRYIQGTCPNCSNPDAYGDQCERCGSTLSPMELINPRSAISGNTPVLKMTKHWYFPLDKEEGWLREYIENGLLDNKQHHNVNEWKKHVVGQCKSWMDGGLHPRAMTRDLDWGIKVPVEGADGKVLYVWFDAPIGYISATKAWAKENNQDWEKWWKNEETELLHFIGKDNIVFHCIIFPAMLNAEGSYLLPHNVPANQFLNLEGKKMSTSRGWTVWLHDYLEAFPGRQDALRYALTMTMPENKDADFSWKEFQARNDNELAANLGNFTNRVLVLNQKYFEGVLQDYQTVTDETDKALLIKIGETYKAVEARLEKFEFKLALQEIMNLSSAGNAYLAETAPWKAIKTDSVRTGQILNMATQLVAQLAVLLQPFLPHTSSKMAEMLDVKEDFLAWPKDGGLSLLPNGHQLGTPSILFEKIEDEQIQKQLDKLTGMNQEATAVVTNYPPLKETIKFDDFVKLDLRVGKVMAAAKVPKSSKLLNLTIDLGFEQRTILSGIAKYFTPQDVIGTQVCIVANLAPRKMMGIESNGMVLMAENPDGSLRLISPQEATENGMGIS